MLLLEELVAKSQKLPMNGGDLRIDREKLVTKMVDRGLSMFSGVINPAGVFLPVHYFEYVTEDAKCDRSTVTHASISIDTYAMAGYHAISGMHEMWVLEHARFFPERVAMQRCLLPLPLVSESMVTTYIEMFQVILNNLEQNKGASPIVRIWRDMQWRIVHENGINSVELLGHKIASNCLLFLNQGCFTWAKELSDLKTANTVAKDVLLDLADVARQA